MQDFEYLSFGDALFLLLERAEAPLNIASVSIFDGVIEHKELVKFIQSRLPLAPRFRQRVVNAPLNIGLPHWETDLQFDIKNHIREVRLRRGTEIELRNLVGRLFSCALDRRHPLWDITLVQGLKPERSALIIRAHHAMADGVSGVGLLDVLMDTTRTTRKTRRAKLAKVEVRPTDLLTSAAGDFLNWWLSSVGRVLSVESEMLHLAQKMMSSLSAPAEEEGQESTRNVRQSKLDTLGELLPGLSAPAVRLPFNKVCKGPQRFTWTEISFERIRRIKNKAGVTVNDAILTVVSAAYRDFAELLGAKIAGRAIRIVIPVNTRDPSANSDLGNQITFAPIDVPLHIRSLPKLLTAVNDQTLHMKSTGLAQLVALAGRLLGVIPPALQAAIAPLISQLPISLCNVICTNIPGPKEPRYILGHKMVHCYPYVPIGGEMALNCAVLTYDGTAYFGFSGDAVIGGELDRIATSLNENFDKLERSLGLAARVKKPKARIPVVRKSKLRKLPLPAVRQLETAESETQQPEPVTAKAMAAAG